MGNLRNYIILPIVLFMVTLLFKIDTTIWYVITASTIINLGMWILDSVMVKSKHFNDGNVVLLLVIVIVTLYLQFAVWPLIFIWFPVLNFVQSTLVIVLFLVISSRFVKE